MSRLLAFIFPLFLLVLAACGGMKTDDDFEPSPVDLSKVYGAQANPTGSPIGGGDGYKNIVTSGDFTVNNKDELLNALSMAKDGQVIFIQ